MLVFIISLALSFLLFKAPRQFVLAILPLISWLFFHGVVAYQVWITRLEMPLFFLLPISTGIVFTKLYARQALMARALLILMVVACLTYGFAVARGNISRQPKLYTMLHPQQFETYYNSNPTPINVHEKLLNEIETGKYTALGIIGNENTYEYPIAWRLYKKNIPLIPITDSSNISTATLIWNDNADTTGLYDFYKNKGFKILSTAP